MIIKLFNSGRSALFAGLTSIALSTPCFANTQELTAHAQNNKAKCENITTLYREVEAQNRITKLTPQDDSVLLSRHYCVGFYGNDKLRALKAAKAAEMISRYSSVGLLLRTDAEKVAFAHVFLKQLSQKKWVLPRTNVENQLTILLPAHLKDGTKMNLNLNLTLSVEDYLSMHEGLTTLATLEDDSKVIDAVPGIEGLVKWVIKGTGNTDYFDGYVFNSLLPDGVGSSCPILENCQVNYDETFGSDGYNWDWYNSTGYELSIEEGRRIEEELCEIYGCQVMDDINDDYGENCLAIYYPDDGHMITGLYCELQGENP